MLTSKITPAKQLSADTLYYDAGGRVHRVFDTNGWGELIPVAYSSHSYGTFNLHFTPHGKVYAEITTDYS